MSFFPEQQHSSPIAIHASVELTEKIVRKLLASLHAPAELQAFVSYFSGKENGADLHQYISALLSGEATALSSNDRTLLSAAYLLHPNNSVAAAQFCNMSRATFYRHLRSAVSNLTEVLKNA